jgi:hypothetical protein
LILLLNLQIVIVALCFEKAPAPDVLHPVGDFYLDEQAVCWGCLAAVRLVLVLVVYAVHYLHLDFRPDAVHLQARSFVPSDVAGDLFLFLGGVGLFSPNCVN